MAEPGDRARDNEDGARNPADAVGGPRLARWAIWAVVVAALLWLWSNRGNDADVAAAFATWHHDMDTAMSAAADSGKPLFVLFTADWCGPCQKLKRRVLSKPQVTERLHARFEPVKIELDGSDANTAVARGHGVSAIPAMLVLDATGAERDRKTGGMSAPRFMAWLDDLRTAPASGPGPY